MDLPQRKKQFVEMANMPNTLGCIDCTHIGIRAPSANEHLYVNRKNFHSINVQAIVDAQLHFTNVCARWPGSTHDSFIWQSSRVYEDFRESRIPSGWLLGMCRFCVLFVPMLNQLCILIQNI